MYETESSQISSIDSRPTQQQQREQREQVTTTTTTTHLTNVYDETQRREQQRRFGPEATLSGIVGDLETTIMFATAGTLRAQADNNNDEDNYLSHRENVLRCAKALVDDTRPLVASATSDTQQLAQAAQESVYTMSRLAESVKCSAASLGPNNTEHQVCLIRSVKDVAVSLADLIDSTKSAMGAADSNDPRLGEVKSSAKTMVSSVTSLLKTVKTVEEEQQRGARAIESALEAIEQELASYNAQCAHTDSEVARASRCAPDEIVRVARPVTMATVKSVHAGSSGLQDDAILAANMGRKAVADLLQITRTASYNTESYELRTRTQDAGRQCATSYKHLIEQLLRIFQNPSVASANDEAKQELIAQSKHIATCVTELISCSELLRGQDWVDPDDPNVVAETELLGAASSIDAAAKKLENLKPRVTSVKLPHEDLNFDEIILDAAKSIIEATAALLRAASASQRELTVDGRLDETNTFYAPDNNQWSEGLVSAARMVAAATHSLVEAANALVQGQASEERLISAAKQVASSTNQLLVACKVKADPDSRTMTRLLNAGNQVKRATDNLVRAAQQAIAHDEDQSLVISNRKVSGIAQEISAREQILRKEKELQQAKTNLIAIRKAKYANRPDDYRGYGGSLG